MNDMSIYDKIRLGHYDSAVEFPDRPKRPANLNRKVQDLTNDELREAITVRERYEADMEAYNKAKDAYYASLAEGHERFRQDALEYVGYADHPKASKLYGKAWDRGHSGGLSEVLSALEDYAELLD